ncbi:MAG: hypothetical protein JWO37_543 [Acidimicrobiales bacterium]|jgi:uncharacterized OB-fold protein|nr:hypothetical protein [Acidimicrobiales bacterium]
MSSVPRPMPVLEGLTAAFYGHLRRRELRFQRCSACGEWRHPPRARCRSCGSEQWQWETSTGRGRVFSWTTVHQPIHPAFADVPYAVLVVEMDEGVRMIGGLAGLEPSGLALDLPVVATFDPIDEMLTLVRFTPGR